MSQEQEKPAVESNVTKRKGSVTSGETQTPAPQTRQPLNQVITVTTGNLSDISYDIPLTKPLAPVQKPRKTSVRPTSENDNQAKPPPSSQPKNKKKTPQKPVVASSPPVAPTATPSPSPLPPADSKPQERPPINKRRLAVEEVEKNTPAPTANTKNKKKGTQDTSTAEPVAATTTSSSTTSKGKKANKADIGSSPPQESSPAAPQPNANKKKKRENVAGEGGAAASPPRARPSQPAPPRPGPPTAAAALSQAPSYDVAVARRPAKQAPPAVEKPQAALEAHAQPKARQLGQQRQQQRQSPPPPPPPPQKPQGQPPRARGQAPPKPPPPQAPPPKFPSWEGECMQQTPQRRARDSPEFTPGGLRTVPEMPSGSSVISRGANLVPSSSKEAALKSALKRRSRDRRSTGAIAAREIHFRHSSESARPAAAQLSAMQMASRTATRRRSTIICEDDQEPAIVWVVGPPGSGKKIFCETLRADLAKSACAIEVLYWRKLLTGAKNPPTIATGPRRILSADRDIVLAVKGALLQLPRQKAQCVLVYNFPLNLHQALMFEKQMRGADAILAFSKPTSSPQGQDSSGTSEPMEPDAVNTTKLLKFAGSRFPSQGLMEHSPGEHMQNVDCVLFRYRERVVYIDADQEIDEMLQKVKPILKDMGLIRF